jgi:hypothetical protein
MHMCGWKGHHCCRGRGAVTWFPVHCTSINNTNSLISGDNKGVAAQFLEGWAAGAGGNATVDKGFVGAFGQANVGDTSPNVLGAFCQDTGILLSVICRESPCQRRLAWSIFTAAMTRKWACLYT